MAKLYALFAGANLSTELDTECRKSPMWVVGRQPQQGDRTGLYFRGPSARYVSRTHAFIRFTPICGNEVGDGIEGLWEIQHVSKNGYTLKNRYDRQAILKPGKWYSIVDGDKFYFTKPSNWISFSTVRNDTLRVKREAIPAQEDLVNINQEIDKYQAQQKTQSQIENPESPLDFLAGVLKALWRGPIETESPTWLKVGWQTFIVLVVAGISVVFGIEKIITLLIKVFL